MGDIEHFSSKTSITFSQKALQIASKADYMTFSNEDVFRQNLTALSAMFLKILKQKVP